MTNQKRKGMTNIDARRATSLLYPIAAFLRAGGMSNLTALELFSGVLKTVERSSSGRKMEHIGHPTGYADIVATWVRNKRFLDQTGWPRPLPIKGRSGFAALVRATSQHGDPNKILAVLMRYGNVRRTRCGDYELVRPFFYTSGPKSMAYEPVAYFLSDASATLSKILKRRKQSIGPELFWQKTENAHISDATAKRFMHFAKERSLVFLDEIDDWLEANSNQDRGGRRNDRRVGLGIFSVHSDRELSRS